MDDDDGDDDYTKAGRQFELKEDTLEREGMGRFPQRI
jgi:hypothetical protein